MAPTVHSLPPPPGSDIDFGAIVENIDLENLTDDDFSVIHRALYENLVVVVKNQHHLSPKAQYELTRRFDPAASQYGHGKTLDAKRSILHPDLKTVPHQPQVQVIGHGFVEAYEGLTNIQLKHPHHRTFHRDAIPDEEDYDFTRFYRWHIDAALYDFYPPNVTTLLAVRVPKGRRQTLRYDDGSNETLDVPLGTTAFVSGERMFEMLSDEDKQFALTSRVEYAPHPYIWMSSARALPTGLGLYSEDKELPLSDLPPIDESKIQVLPMVWKNPLTDKPALQIHPSAVRKIHRKDGTVIDDLARVREIVYKLQRPAISPPHVYPHDWEEGDLVLFNNRGVIHSVVGAFGKDEVRLFRQCNLAAGEAPLAYEA
ncbi:alpha-ketoglutarate dependent xanthine dioxygenase [Aspergillus eucalypticola CBS 122712]|uniref:Alpha-ketoglutarate-dependent xanthine dioxygenase xanA n=1 Tax=Aspergillus eucalypticola (strain CBS 122712 / IBT 29274) TaxID=1448314 RepID=A0A317V6P2_ASPEC|nr:alpha-ketoglutarate dependent xanthine dioxygenase [Aspergillus eucalypticola CBS 122712]PWY67820.1 alpha-ketoglutarate dependent xanthine dioxygenase [Aspergillus eucalypticola CBS 122712]